MFDRRFTRRYPLARRLQFNIAGEPELTTVARDLSLGGVGVLASRSFEVGTEFQLGGGFSATDSVDPAIKTRCQVSASTPAPGSDGYILGLHFVELPSPQRKVLNRLLKQKENQKP